jgi:hypothetical protein
VRNGVLEYWSDGVLAKERHSNTPVLQHSIPPALPCLLTGHTVFIP